MFLSLILISSLQAVALNPEAAEEVIYRGQKIQPQSEGWKFTVGISYFHETKEKIFHCTGAFIAPDTIVTAGHCAIDTKRPIGLTFYPNGKNKSPLKAIAGEDYSHLRHPSFTGQGGDPHDLAILVLRNFRLPPGFRPALLPTTGALKPAERLIAIGTGSSETGKSKPSLFFAAGEVSSRPSVDSKDVIEVNFEGMNGACTGDSGGPVIASRGNPRVIVGLIASAYPNLSDICSDTIVATTLYGERQAWILNSMEEARAAILNSTPTQHSQP